MLVKTRGIVLHSRPYGENSLIVTLYTEDYGRLSGMIHAARGGQSGNKSPILQPLFILDIEMYLKPGRELQRIREIKLFRPYLTIPFHIIKSTQVLFLAEILYKTIREVERNSELFSFVENGMLFLDSMTEGIANFHLWFLARFTEFAGIHPNLENGTNGWFDLKKGITSPNEPKHPFFMDPETTIIFMDIITRNINDLGQFNINNSIRNILINKILEYYHLHFENLENFKSLAVLHAVFQE